MLYAHNSHKKVTIVCCKGISTKMKILNLIRRAQVPYLFGSKLSTRRSSSQRNI